jgi:hypothetical protein
MYRVGSRKDFKNSAKVFKNVADKYFVTNKKEVDNVLYQCDS